jgi:endonuclease/exonuclease/phosphatase family metal-dependent hydrolase
VSAGGPDVVCLQEVPVWGIEELGAWSGMTVIAHMTRRPILPTPVGRWLTDRHDVGFRSLFTGQANAVLVGPRLRILESRRLVLNDGRFRKAQTRQLNLDVRTRLAWANERRVCQAVRVALPDGRSLLTLNVHATSLRTEGRVTDLELLRAFAFADELAKPEEAVIIAGDFNASLTHSKVLVELATSAGFSAPGPGIDHILVRGIASSQLEVWPEQRRRLNARVLSDHAPVELYVE